MSAYIIIFILSSLFSFLYSFSKDKSLRFAFLILCFLSLFIPAALRGGIGADYFSYLTLYKNISLGIDNTKEPGLFAISKLLLYFNLPGHSLIITYSFITLFFVFITIPRKYFFLGIPIYVLIFYLDSYCLLRQSLACSIMLYAYKKYFQNKNISFFIWSIIAILNHKVMIIPVLLILFSKLIPKLSVYFRTLILINLSFILYFIKNKLISFLMNTLIYYTPYSKYAYNKYAYTEPNSHSGLGFLLQIILLIILMYLIEYGTISKKEYKVSIIGLLYIVFARCLNQVLYIFNRLVSSISFIYLFLIFFATKSKNKFRKLFLVFIYISLILLYIKGIKNTPISGGAFGGKQIYPYTTIFNYYNNQILINKKHKYDL